MDVHHRAEVREVRFSEGLVAQETGVIDQNIEPTAELHCGVDHA